MLSHIDGQCSDYRMSGGLEMNYHAQMRSHLRRSIYMYNIVYLRRRGGELAVGG